MQAFLSAIGLEKYLSAFAEAEIDLETLPLLSDQDLRDLGLPLGPRRKLLRAIEGLTGEGPQANAPARALSGPNMPQDMGAERRHMTMIFVDLVGSVTMSEKCDPEVMRHILVEYQKQVAAAVARFDGFVAQYLGDGVLCYFGWPVAHEDDAERALRAGLEIIARVREMQFAEVGALECRVGVATGVVVVGDLFTDQGKQEASVVGDTPNLAARLQALAKPNQLVISSNTRAIIGDAFTVEALGQRRVKGFAAPIRPYLVTQARIAESRFATMQKGEPAPLVGRDKDLQELRSHWAQAGAGNGRMVLITGEAGIGKSRLVRALIDTVQGADHVRITCQCSPYHTESAFYPIVRFLTGAAGIEQADSDADKLHKLAGLAGVDAPDLGLFASLLDIEAPAGSARPDLSPSQLRMQMMDVLARSIAGQSRDSPLLFIFEDLHWIDPTSLELIELLLDRLGERQMMIVATARPVFDHRFGGHPAVNRMALSRLGTDQIRLMVAGVTDGRALPMSIVQEIASRTDGVPLFIEELTKTVLESASIVEQDGELIMTGEISSSSIPSTLHDSLMARLDRRNLIKEVAQLAACIGREFDHDLLSRISPYPEEVLAKALEDLIDAELIFRRGVPPNTRYQFKHALLRDAAYDSLLKERRRALQNTILGVLETRSGVAPEVLARHAEAAGHEDRAIDLWEAASKAAIARPAYEEAIAHLRRAMALMRRPLAGDDPAAVSRALGLQVQLSVAILTRWGYGSDDSRGAFEYALLLADRLGETPLRFAVLYGLWVGEYVRAEYTKALARARSMVRLAENESESAPLLLANRLVGVCLCLTGRLPEAESSLQTALALFDPVAHTGLETRFGQDLGVSTHCYLMYCTTLQGRTRDGVAHGKKARDRALTLAHANTTGYLYAHLGFNALLLGDDAAFASVSDELGNIASEHNLDLWLDTAAVFAGLLAIERQGADGIEAFLAADRNYSSKKSLAQLSLCRIQAGWRALRVNELQSARSIAREARALIELTGEAYPLSDLHRLEGMLARSHGDEDAAETHLRHALRIAQDQSAMLWALRGAVDLSTLLHQQGRTQAAAQVLRPVVQAVPPGDCPHDRDAAVSLLEGLSKR